MALAQSQRGSSEQEEARRMLKEIYDWFTYYPVRFGNSVEPSSGEAGRQEALHL
jgi:hypothetical protein